VRPLLATLAVLCLGATCQRREESRVEVQREVTVDAGVRVEVQGSTEVDREEVRVAGPVEVVRVVEVLAAPADGGQSEVVRRTTTTVRRAPVTATVTEHVREATRVEAAATVVVREVAKVKAEVEVEKESAWGPSWGAWAAIAFGVILAAALAWRLRTHWLA
jgi:hypothetical protein